MPKTPEQIAREAIDRRLNDAGWVIQDMNKINLSAALGVAIPDEYRAGRLCPFCGRKACGGRRSKERYRSTEYHRG